MSFGVNVLGTVPIATNYRAGTGFVFSSSEIYFSYYNYVETDVDIEYEIETIIRGDMAAAMNTLHTDTQT